MISGVLVGDSSVVAGIRRRGQEARERIHATVQRLTLQLLRRVKEQKLSGQVLNVRTGRLRRSINQRVEEAGTKITGRVGTNVEYAPAHEYGFKGMVEVREHLRRARDGMRPVRAHKRKVNIPQRSFLRSSLKDMEPEARRELMNTLLRALG